MLVEMGSSAEALGLARLIEARRAEARRAEVSRADIGPSAATRAPGSGGAPRDASWAAIEDLVTGARTVLVVAKPTVHLAALRRALLDLTCVPMSSVASPVPDSPPGELVQIPVRYDGPDLADVAALTGLSPPDVVAAHLASEWEVGFTGFAPGFGYLVGGDPRLTVPRRANPRPRVAAGSVALAGSYSGIYPSDAPGGWQLIGHTDVTLWDLHRDPPALLRPGVRVRFRDVAQR